MELTTGNDDAGRRLDRIVRAALPDFSLSLIHRLLRQGRVLVNGRAAQGADRVPAGAVITINALPPVSRPAPPASPPPAGGRFLELPPILWQGDGLLILNKPAGLAVHGPESLDTLVQAYLAGRLPPSLSFRPGPLHRLDKPSSGVIVFSTGLEGARRFSALMREGRLRKQYLAIVEGRIERSEIWHDELVRDNARRKTFAAGPEAAAAGGEKFRSAVTRARPLAANAGYTLLLAEIGTGRTHQIRAQAAAHGHPLAGDVKYGGRGGTRRGGEWFLHAWKLEREEPAQDESVRLLAVTAPPPPAFQQRIRELFGISISEISDRY
jgi:23S rRNA pseudouridine955/2504/2580 synthase